MGLSWLRPTALSAPNFMAPSGFKYRPNGIRSVELAKYFVFHVEQKVKRLVIGRLHPNCIKSTKNNDFVKKLLYVYTYRKRSPTKKLLP